MKKALPIILLLVILTSLLPGCGREPDAETIALVEESDAVCLVQPFGKSVYVQEIGGIQACLVRTDYLGNLTDKGQTLNDSDYAMIYVVENKWWYHLSQQSSLLLLYLDVLPEEYNGYALFCPHGETGIRPDDGSKAVLCLQEQLKAYGKAHPRESLDQAVDCNRYWELWTKGFWTKG